MRMARPPSSTSHAGIHARVPRRPTRSRERARSTTRNRTSCSTPGTCASTPRSIVATPGCGGRGLAHRGLSEPFRKRRASGALFLGRHSERRHGPLARQSKLLGLLSDQYQFGRVVDRATWADDLRGHDPVHHVGGERRLVCRRRQLFAAGPGVSWIRRRHDRSRRFRVHDDGHGLQPADFGESTAVAKRLRSAHLGPAARRQHRGHLQDGRPSTSRILPPTAGTSRRSRLRRYRPVRSCWAAAPRCVQFELLRPLGLRAVRRGRCVDGHPRRANGAPPISCVTRRSVLAFRHQDLEPERARALSLGGVVRQEAAHAELLHRREVKPVERSTVDTRRSALATPGGLDQCGRKRSRREWLGFSKLGQLGEEATPGRLAIASGEPRRRELHLGLQLGESGDHDDILARHVPSYGIALGFVPEQLQQGAGIEIEHEARSAGVAIHLEKLVDPAHGPAPTRPSLPGGVALGIETLAGTPRLPQANELGHGLAISGDGDLALCSQHRLRARPPLTQIPNADRLHGV